MINLFVSFSCKINGIASDGNTVFHCHTPVKNMEDIMGLEAEIKELFEETHPGQQLDNACILNIVKL